jgi:hypothetical protein
MNKCEEKQFREKLKIALLVLKKYRKNGSQFNDKKFFEDIHDLYDTGFRVQEKE